MPLDDAFASNAPPSQPSARKPRRESRASVLGHTDASQSATADQAKDNVHISFTSQDLTVFSDLTEPPADTTQPENTGVTGDVQGGLSGLYSKFRATMAGGRDTDATPKSVSTDVILADKVESNTATASTSGKTSRVQSPRVAAHDASSKMELPIPKFSAKSVKLGLPSPGLRSPNAAPSTGNIADPALTSVHIHATGNLRSHSRAGSLQGADESFHSDRSVHSPIPIEGQNLRKVLSRIDQDPRLAASRQERLPPTLAKIDTRTQGQSRDVSDTSNHAQKHKGPPRTVLTPSNADSNNPLAALATQHVDPTAEHQSPLELLADHILDQRQYAVPSHRALPRDPASRPVKRVSQSRLPGFSTSRTSSTDSIRTSGTVATGRDSRPFADDGFRDDIKYHNYSRASGKLHSRLLKKEFWMRDENARDCFRCGEIFTTFRRKHHCRTCGQIFDNKCTSLVSGSFFGVPGPVRLCKPCEIIVTNRDDDSSDYSDDMTVADFSARPRTPDHSLARYDDDNVSMVSQSLDQIARTPVMNFPVRRAFDKSNRSSATLEFDAPNSILHRPSSSRSLRTAHTMAHGHKRHHSKHQHIRSMKSYHDERVPFQKETNEDLKGQQISAFHRDSVIDPELQQYLSDDASSDDEPNLQPSHSSDKLSRSGPDGERITIGGLIAAMRKGSSRMGDRSIAGFLNFNARDAEDAASMVSARAIDGLRGSRKRNLSVASSVHTKMTPRSTRERLQIVLPIGAEPESPASSAVRGSRMMRSASMHGIAAPNLELNRASIQHVHKMLRQLLKDKGISKVSSWEDALIPILLKATDDVDPDVQGGDDIDIRSYVKLKKIPGGRPMDTSYTSGLIFSKNVALKSMQRTIIRPRILIVTFPLEYARSEARFMSLDPVIRQEREYLQNLVSRIAALKPDVLLAQRNISGLALELLEKVRIAVVYNIKPTVLEAVSRCTNSAIHHSVDKLTLPAEELGSCDLFEVKTYLVEGRRKTYIYLSGCPPELGCTIALRGASRQVLGKIKEITDFMIYVVYNLKLETCLMRDEWALIPTGDDLARSPTPVGPAKMAKQPSESVPEPELRNGLSESAGTDAPVTEASIDNKSEIPPEVKRMSTNDSSEIPADIPVPTFYQDLADKHQSRILSASPFVKFAQPYLLMRARELERRVAWLRKLRDQDLSDSISIEEKSRVQKFTLIVPEMVHNPLENASKKVREIVHAVHDAEYDKALYHYENQKKMWEQHLANNTNLFDPYSHQEIVVLFSTVSTHTHVPCLGPDMLAFKFYNEHEHDRSKEIEPDCTLGQYVEDLCYRANDVCPAEACGKRMHEHQRQYVHGEAQVTVFVEPYPPKMRGLQDIILMWSTCKICGLETTVTPMSSSTWKYSFGKYLELSFWSADLHARAGVCSHDLHRQHLRYFGYKGFALRVHYDSIDLLEIITPRMRITWKVDADLRFRNEAFTRIEHRIIRFMSSVKFRLKSINVEALLPESVDACHAEVDRLTKLANEDHTMLIKKLQELYTNSQHWQIIPLNLAFRTLMEKVADWDEAFSEFEKNFFPSERDIRRLATLQLKKIFLDRDVSVTSLTSADEENAPPEADALNEKEVMNPATTRKLSPEKTQNVLQSVMEENIGNETSPVNEKCADPPQTALTQTVVGAEDIRQGSADLEHLDLALPESNPKAISAMPNPIPTSVSIHTSENSSKPVAAEVVIHQSSRERQLSSDGMEGATQTESLQNSAMEIIKSTTANRSQLPTPSHLSSRRGTISRPGSPTLVRAQSQPTGSLPQRKDYAQPKPSTMSAVNALNGFGSGAEKKANEVHQESTEKKLSERLGFTSLNSHKSLIPRAISNKQESHVSRIAKHFDQLTREFEQARVRERRQKAARNRRPQIYPAFTPKPVVEVYKNINEAVDEADESGESLGYPENVAVESTPETTVQAMADTTQVATPKQEYPTELSTESTQIANEDDSEVQQSSHAPSEAEDRTDIEDDEDQDSDDIYLPDSPEDLLRLSQEDIEFKDLQKHERTSLMKLLTNFWAERSSSGWATLEYPFFTSDHIFADCDIIVREDELSSIIAFALDSRQYKAKLSQISLNSSREASVEASRELDAEEDEDTINQSLLRKTGTHLKYAFDDGSAKMLCKVFFAEQFEAMRTKCGVAERFIESLSRCGKFDSKGGKSKSLFLKTLDDRFVLKSLSPIETQSFLKFAPNYFEIMSEAFFHDLPSVIAKMLGFYQIIVKNPATGVEHNWFLLVMENLFYDRVPTRIFDLKGSMRNRKINVTGERNEVLLDENMVDYIYESPLFAREHSKKILRSSVHNDTLFLARQNVMDYSLMIAIDEARKELVVGIIDCIRTFTWDKKLESWIKDRGFISAVMGASVVGGGAVSGGKNRPTVTSPKEYKRRFREAMSRYVLEAPTCWHQLKGKKAGQQDHTPMGGMKKDGRVIGGVGSAEVREEEQTIS